MTFRILTIAAAALLAACASDGAAPVAEAAATNASAADDCAGADWAEIGRRDGLYGEAAEKLAERQTCATFDLAAYEQGRARGLKTYCTPEAGFDAGRNGRDYRGVCAPEIEAAFLAEYEDGRRIYDRDRRIENLKTAYAEAGKAIESRKFELKRALERYNDVNATPEQRSRAVADVDSHRREIDRLETEMPKIAEQLSAMQREKSE